MHRIRIVGSCIAQPVHRRSEAEGEALELSPEERWALAWKMRRYGIQPDDLSPRWRKAWGSYQQEQLLRRNVKVIRAMLEAMGPPPEPEPMVVSLDSLAWFEQASTVSLAALDAAFPSLADLNHEGGKHGQQRVRGSSHASRR